ncbi:hypothetical protein [Enterococcus faecium]|uniref:hypothetical protein n=1 Tax=Enterococcus TaxID=1350 RepID=UPI000CF24D32|nr:hypothetical protein [Enterococcus faecium]PQF33147.1 hypothetical protein CUS87_10420 [Enterococcus faecium]RBT17125.1 hypothetical protein EA95_01624 [Enterococcus faecium]RBT28973.1 hypothetical protein EA72_00991 [Enterococcus faecium]RBT31382.1 hypothetical protein EB01_01309 [Enterococcus faecium]
MTEKKYIDMDGMQKRADAAHKEHLDKVWNEVQRKTEKVRNSNREVQALFGKAIQQEIDEEERNIIKKMEVEKTKAIKQIEDKFGSNCTKTQVAKAAS